MSQKKEILRVKGNIKEIYTKFSKIYSPIEERFERKLKKSLELLDIQEGEVVLEIGFGTGCSLVEIARSVGEKEKVYGLDVTFKMVELAKKRVEKEGLAEKVSLCEGNAKNMPYQDDVFDAIYMAGALELLDTPDISRVLEEIKRVLKWNGRIGIASIPKENHEDSRFLRFYEWIHKTFPRYASCRPIYLEDSLKDAEYKVIKTDEILLGKIFPMKIVVAKP